MPGQHAVLAPSSAPQWGRCAGSVQAQKDIPNPDTPESLEGDAAHWVAAETLHGYLVMTNGQEHGGDCGVLLGATAPNGQVVTDKMVEGAQIFVNDVLGTAEHFRAFNLVTWETRVACPDIHPNNWGTYDAALPLIGERRIYLWDYKHGHRDNPAEENLQLINYALGLADTLNIDGLLAQEIDVVLRIVQPFTYDAAGPIKEWVVKLSDLRPYANQLHAQAHEALGGNPTLTTGSWCRDCRAVGLCEAARRAAYNTFNLTRQPYAMDAMDSLSLATERQQLLEAGVLVKARLEAIEDNLTHRIEGGDVKSGLTLQSSAGRLKWTVEAQQAIALAAQFGADISKPDVLTPLQAVAAVPPNLRTQFKQLLPGVSRRPAGGLKLVNIDDTISAQAFNKQEQ